MNALMLTCVFLVMASCLDAFPYKPGKGHAAMKRLIQSGKITKYERMKKNEIARHAFNVRCIEVFT